MVTESDNKPAKPKIILSGLQIFVNAIAEQYSSIETETVDCTETSAQKLLLEMCSTEVPDRDTVELFVQLLHTAGIKPVIRNQEKKLEFIYLLTTKKPD